MPRIRVRRHLDVALVDGCPADEAAVDPGGLSQERAAATEDPPVSKPRQRFILKMGGKIVAISAPDVVQRKEPEDEAAVDPEAEANKALDDAGDPIDADGDDEFLERVDKEISNVGEDIDEEDAPDWAFEEGETKSKDPNYVFCPAPHRPKVLQLFTEHYCRHPIFLSRHDGLPHTAAQIREKAVQEMYLHCKRNSLAEVWAYMWTNWYAPKKWVLWARSSSAHLSRLRTTMTVENHWKQLKHHYLHFQTRPRLDHAIFIICTRLIPDFMLRAETLEDAHRLGRPRGLTTFQKTFKASWRRKAAAQVSGREYKTDVLRWQCSCGAQELDAHHICKHLVQAVPTPEPKFFTEVVRRRTVPLYRHRCLHPLGVVQEYSPQDGSVSDGDDHEYLGRTDVLRSAGGVDGGGWGAVLSGEARESLLKRKRAGTDTSQAGREAARQRLAGEGVDSGDDGDDEAEEVSSTWWMG